MSEPRLLGEVLDDVLRELRARSDPPANDPPGGALRAAGRVVVLPVAVRVRRKPAPRAKKS